MKRSWAGALTFACGSLLVATAVVGGGNGSVLSGGAALGGAAVPATTSGPRPVARGESQPLGALPSDRYGASVAASALAATTSPDRGRIVAHSADELTGEHRIYAVGADGSGFRWVATGHWPRVSPDGTRVSFSDGTDIFVAPTDGSAPPEPLRLMRPAFGAEWSPSGNHLAFLTSRPLVSTEVAGRAVYDSGYQFQVVVADLANDYASEVGWSLETEWEPSWSPDGRELAFLHGGRLAIADIEIHEVREVGTPLDGWNRGARDTAWGPTGEIAVTTEPSGLWFVRPDAARATFVPGDGDGRWERPVWSPRGDALAVIYWGPTGAEPRVVILDRNGNRLFEGEGHAAAWSPDGSYVAVCARDGLRRMRTDGRESTLLAGAPCRDVDW